MTAPDRPATAPTKLDEARAALHAALQLTMADCGWPAERAYPIPPTQGPLSPAAWVDIPTLHVAATESAGGVAATFPVVLTVNGSEAAQLRALDVYLASAWTRLEAADTPRPARPQTAGPEDVAVGGTTVRGLVIRVQVTLLSRTLCQQTLTQ